MSSTTPPKSPPPTDTTGPKPALKSPRNSDAADVATKEKAPSATANVSIVGFDRPSDAADGDDVADNAARRAVQPLAVALADSIDDAAKPLEELTQLITDKKEAAKLERRRVDRVLLAVAKRGVELDASDGNLDSLFPTQQSAVSGNDSLAGSVSMSGETSSFGGPVASGLRRASNSSGPSATATATTGSFAVSMSGSGYGSMRSQSSVDTEVLQAFVSGQALRTLEHLNTDQSEPCLTSEAALLFVDISGYSAVTTALESKGPFALSEAVNAYLETVLSIVDDWRGDVLNFAGDAVTVAFTERNCSQASAAFAVLCAAELLKRCGEHEVPGAGGRKFSLHIGVAAGKLNSYVFQRPGARSMQPAFPFVTGKPLKHVGIAVDAAKPGEMCADGMTVELLGMFDGVAVKTAPVCLGGESDNDACCKKGCVCDMFKIVSVEDKSAGGDIRTEADGEFLAIKPEASEDQLKRFVHPAIYKRLTHAASATSIAELRFLAVLFIGMLETDTHTTVRDWFTEVCAVLDDHECPVLQLIDDDKGVHVVAAVSLVFVDRLAASTATRIARALQEQEIGCAVGIACGQVFCGVMGAETACRWDIAGPACVRACRLMQLAQRASTAAVNNDVTVSASGTFEADNGTTRIMLTNVGPVLADASVYGNADKALLQDAGSAKVKGTPDGIPLYTLAAVDTRVLSLLPQENIFGWSSDIHGEQFDKLSAATVDRAKLQRFAGVIHGPTGCGKATLALRVAQRTKMVAIGLTCERGQETVQVSRALAQWFAHHRDPVLRDQSTAILAALAKRHHLKALRLSLDLIDLTVAFGMHTVLIVRSAQYVDETSLSLTDQAMKSPFDPDQTQSARVKGLFERIGTSVKFAHNDFGSGRFGVFYCVTPLFGCTTWKHIVGQGAGPQPVTVSPGAFAASSYLGMFQSFGFSPTDVFANTNVSKSMGNLEASAAIGDWLGSLRPFISKVDVYGVGTLPPTAVRRIRRTSYLTFSPPICAKIMQEFDLLSPGLRSLVRIIAQGVEHEYGDLPLLHLVAVVRKVMRRGFSEERLERDLEQLETFHVLSTLGSVAYGGFVRFKHPATVAVVNGMTTPKQRRAIHDVYAEMFDDGRKGWDEEPMEYLSLAHHLRGAGKGPEAWRVLAAGWRLFLKQYPSDSNTCDDVDGVENLYSEALASMRDEYDGNVAAAKWREARRKEKQLHSPAPTSATAPKKKDDDGAADDKKSSAFEKRKPADCDDCDCTNMPACGMAYSQLMFSGAPRQPELCEFAYEAHADIPWQLLNAKNHRPSLALGPLAYYIIDFGWALRGFYMMVNTEFSIPAAYLADLKARVATYMKLVRWYDRIAYTGDSAAPSADELEKRWAAEETTVSEFLRPRAKFNFDAANEYNEYVSTTVKERAARGEKRVMELVASGASAVNHGLCVVRFHVYACAFAELFPGIAGLRPEMPVPGGSTASCDSPQGCDAAAPCDDGSGSNTTGRTPGAAGSPLNLLKGRGPMVGKSPADVEPHKKTSPSSSSSIARSTSGIVNGGGPTLPAVTRDGVCGALMALATANWQQVHPRIGLQFIRSECLWTKSQTMESVAAFLWFHREHEASVECADMCKIKSDDPNAAFGPYTPLVEPPFNRPYKLAEHCKPRDKPSEADAVKTSQDAPVAKA